MRRLFLLAAALLPLCASLRAQDDVPRLSRSLADLRLGDSESAVRKLYAPLRPWTRELKRGVDRIYIRRGDVQEMPDGVETMRLGLRRGRLADIQLIYNAEATRQKPVAALVDDLSLIYGVPHRNESKFWWVDGKTVIRVYYEEVPAPGGGDAVELRTSMQVMEADLFQ